MPYNTRRKSLSLTELGITIPKRSRAISHPSPPSTVAEGDEPPIKKSKRSHASSPPPSAPAPTSPRTASIRFKDERPIVAALSPPPSPRVETANKVDTQGIHDEIVVATIKQLEHTGNRPHLVKELAHVLASSLHCIEKSANPTALISSRLTAYLNRSWPTISPCPLAKDLSSVHPRRLYFYLTTMPHLPIPEVAEPLPEPKRIISPSLSSASAVDEDEQRYLRQRTQLSPSPEVDLSSPELDEDAADRPPTPGRPFSGLNTTPRESRSSSLSHQKRPSSPPLEREERDFKQTANQLYEQAQAQAQLRRNSQPPDVNMDASAETTAGAEPHEDGEAGSMSVEESEESVARKNSDDAAALFGHADALQLPARSERGLMDFSSPVIQPQSVSSMHLALDAKHGPDAADYTTLSLKSGLKDLVLPDATFGWDALRSPENIEVDELDHMFDAY